MKPSRSNPLFSRLLGAGAATLIVVSGHAAEIPYKSTATSTADGGLNTNWQGNVLPGAADVAAWTTAGGGGESRGGTITFSSPVSWLGLRHEDSGGALTLTGSDITLGASGITEVRWEQLNIGSNVILGADQTWSIGGSTTTLTGALTGAFNLTKAGGATLNLNGVNTGYTGNLTLSAGTLNTGAFGGSIAVTTGTASITGAIAGGLTVNGGTVTATGGISGAFSMTGGTTTLSAVASGSSSIAGGTLNLNSGATIAAPTVSGGTINVNSGATISGNVDTLGTTTLNLAGSISGEVKLYIGDTLGLRGGTIGAGLTLGEFDSDSGTVNYTSPVTVTGDLLLHGTQTVNLLSIAAPGSPITILNYTGTASDPDDSDLTNNFVVANPTSYRAPSVSVASGAVTVSLGGESHKWVGADPANPSFWNTSALNWNSTDQKFFNGDAVTFDETATGKTVVMQSLLTPYSVTFDNTSAYSVTAITGAGITGGAGITKNGTGTLLLGGPASNFTGPVAINGGVVNLNNGEALGNNSGVTIAAGARLNFNGHSPSAVGKAYSFTIAGDGGDGVGGVGAILTTGVDIFANAGIRNLTLSANAEIGGNNGRFDIGRAAAGNLVGTIDGGGFTLTKVGTNSMVFRGPASNITYVVNAGRLTFEDFNTASGTNPITVNNSGSSLGTYGVRSIPNNVTLNTGTTLINVGGGEGTWAGNITAASGTTINAESGGMTLSGATTASGTVTKTGASQLTLTGNFTNGLVFNQNAGIVQVGNVGTGGNFLGGGTVNVGAGLLFRNRLSGASNTISSNFTFASSSSELRQHAGVSTDTLTLTGTVGTSTTNGILQTQFGRIVLASGANATVNAVPMLGAVATPGTLEVQTGASITTLYFNLGNSGSNAGRLNITGGTATVLAGGSGARIGHWNNNNTTSGSELNVSAGLYDASATGVTTSVGWDGLGRMTVGGGASAATAKVHALSLDSNGDSGTYNCTVTLSPNGLLEVGAGGAFSTSANDYIILNGGRMNATTNSTWSARLDAAQPSTLSANSGTTATITGAVTGSAALTKSGVGTLAFNNAALAYNGTLTTVEGTTQLNANLTAPDLVASGTGTVSLGSSAAGDVIVNAGGTVKTGSAAAVGSATASTLTLDGGTASFRVGNTKDLLTVPVVSVNSPSFISIVPTNALTAPSSFPILKYTGSVGGTSGFAGLSLASSNPHYAATLVDDVPNQQLVVDITAADSVVWKGNINGNWDIDATENWVLGSNLTTPSKYYDFDVVKFDDTGIAANAVTLVGTIRPATLSVENTTGTYTFQGSGISGGTGLTKTGAGNLTLLNDNTYTGVVSIAGGTVTVGNGGTVGSLGGSGSITLSGSTLVLNRSDAQTLNRAIVGTDGSLVKNGGNLTMSAAGNTCDITVNSGTLFARGGGFFTPFAAGKTITVNPGAVLDTSVHSMGSSVGGGGDVPIVVLNGSNWVFNGEQYIRNLTLNAASTSGVTGLDGIRTLGGSVFTVAAATSSSTIGSPFNLFNAVNVVVNDGSAANDLVVTGTISNSGALTKSGAGKMVISGTNSSTGAVTVSGGILEIGAGGTSGTLGTGAVTNNATLAFNRSDALVVPNLIGGTGSVVKNGAGVTTLSAINTYTGNTTVNAGTLSLADNAGLRFVIGANGVNNRVTGTGGVEFLGDFTLDLTGAAVANGNSWTLVDTSTLSEVFVSSFTVVGFTEETPGVHTKIDGANLWTFTEANGTLTVQIQGYSAWAAQITNPDDRDRGDDPDGDGFTNIEEFLFGTSPIEPSATLVTSTTSGGNLILRWLQRETGATYAVKESTTLEGGSWITSPISPALDDQTGVATDYDRWISTIPLGSGSKFFRVEGTEE